MCERKTGKLVTGPAAPTENTLLSWLLRHPSFEVVQPTHQAPQPSMLLCSQFTHARTHAHMDTHNHFMALLDFVRDHPGELAPERKIQSGFLEHKILSGSGISWAVCKSAS